MRRNLEHEYIGVKKAAGAGSETETENEIEIEIEISQPLIYHLISSQPSDFSGWATRMMSCAINNAI